jgi:succinyl-CoA synthetase beta subunit
MDIKGHTVEIVWVEHASDIAEEYYASFTLDRSAKKHLGMLSARGGVDIEAVAARTPTPSPRSGSTPSTASEPTPPGRGRGGANSSRRPRDGAVPRLFLQRSTSLRQGPTADLVEIQPADPTPTATVHASTAKVRSTTTRVPPPRLREYDASQVRDEREAAATTKGLQYVGPRRLRRQSSPTAPGSR